MKKPKGWLPKKGDHVIIQRPEGVTPEKRHALPLAKNGEVVVVGFASKKGAVDIASLDGKPRHSIINPDYIFPLKKMRINGDTGLVKSCGRIPEEGEIVEVVKHGSKSTIIIDGKTRSVFSNGLSEIPKAGDLVRTNTKSLGRYGNLRVVEEVNDQRLEVTNSDGSKNGGVHTIYKPTTMTTDDCKWLKEKGHKVKLRDQLLDLTYEEVKAICKGPLTKISWKSILKGGIGKSFKITKVFADNCITGDIDCRHVIPVAALTLAVGEVKTTVGEVKVKLEEVEVGLTAHELLHGVKESEHVHIEEGVDLTPLPPVGWDNVERGFCCGDWLINRAGLVWGIIHPVISITNHFTDPQSAANFVEEHFQCK